MNVRKSFTALALLFLGWSAAHAEQYTIPLFLAPGTSGDPQGVLRLVNDSGEAATVQVFAIADDGTRAGPATIALGASAAVQFDATELQSANAARGLSGGLGRFPGDVRLSIDSDAPIVPLAFARASDGTLSAMHDTVRPALAEGEPHRYEIPVFNPSTEAAQASRLRLINPGDAQAAVTIAGRDDGGAAAAGGDVTLTLPAGGARTLTARQLEAGDAGLTGRLGATAGGWRLTVSSDLPLQVVNVVASSTGRWNNLSTTAVRGAAPADPAGFNDRFVGQSAILETEDGSSSFAIMANGRFSETARVDGMAATSEGGYDYVALGPDAGQLTQDYDDGRRCRANLYFASRTGGWFASHCTGGLDAEETWRGGNWFVEGEEDDGGGDGGSIQTTYGVNDALPGVPTSGTFIPARLSGGSVRASGGSTTIDLNNGGHIDLNDGTRYTCALAGGCAIVDGTVTRGSVTGRTAGSGGGEIDRFPVFPAAGRPGDRTYTVGTAIDALTLPEATGGNPPLTYSLSPDVPGLSFDAAARRLSGAPAEAGSYAMSYTVTDADGDLHTLHFTIEVGAGEADDHGDTFDTATSVSIPSTTQGELEEGKEDGDRDYFRVVVAAAGTLTVETTGRVDTFGTLFDGSRTQLATNDDGGSGTNFKIERQVQAGTYYVEVRGYRPTRTGSYELRVSAADDTSGGDGGGDPATTFGSGDTISSLPSGTWFPDVTSGGSFRLSGGNVTIQLNNGGYIEEGSYRYTCQSSGGCVIENRRVTSGTVVQTASGTAPGSGGTPGGSDLLAPADMQAFNSRVVGNRFHGSDYYIDFPSAGRFLESGEFAGRYSYSSTGSDTGTLTQTYDDSTQYGGSCTLLLSFDSETTGTVSFTCASGVQGSNSWTITAGDVPHALRVVRDGATNTSLRFGFILPLNAGETKAIDFQFRRKTPQGSWNSGCNTFTNNSANSGTGVAGFTASGLQSGTVYEARYRFRNSSSCNSGSPGPWSLIGEGMTTGPHRDSDSPKAVP